MSSEARTIRPFVGLRLFEEALTESLLHFGTEKCAPDSSIYTEADAHEFSLRPVELEWADDQDRFQVFKELLLQGADDLKVDPSAIAIAVVARTSYLKEASLVFKLPLSEISKLDRVISLTPDDVRPTPFRAWRHGFTVDAYVLLIRSIERSPLRPWRLGTWYARSRFGVKTSHTSSRLFRPIPLDDEQREQFKLPSDTARFVSFGDHDPLNPYDAQAEEPELYIDADLLSELNASPASSPSSQAIQLDLALHFIAAAVYRASRHLSQETVPFEDLYGSLTYRIIRLCAGSVQDEEMMKQIYKDIKLRPERVVGLAENSIGIRSALIKNVKGAD